MADEIDDIVQDTTQQDDTQTHDLTVDNKIPLTGNKSLDDRLAEMAGEKPKDAQTNQADDKSKNADGTPIIPAATKGAQDKGAVQQQQPSTGVGGFAGKAPRAYGPRFNWNARGDVIDKVTGNVIAPVGADRKSFERMLPLINNANMEADKYKGMYESATKANTVAASLGLTPEEFSIGGRIMAQWKADPKKALAFLLKEAQNNGVDVSDLGVAGGPSLTPQQIQTALEEVVKKHLEPFSFIHKDREEQTARNEALQAADSVIQEFYTTLPDARIHEESLAKIMNARPNTSLNEAYLILKNHALENRLDWSKDLVPQIEALVSKTPNGQPARRQRQLPSINGRTNNGNVVPLKTGALSGSASSSDIVKKAMEEAGMDVSNL